MTERTLNLKDDKKEYTNLKRVADILTAMQDDSAIYYVVKDCYLDYGTKWEWTTIIAYNTNETGILSSYQAINPKQWKDIVTCNDKKELLDIVKTIMK